LLDQRKLISWLDSLIE